MDTVYVKLSVMITKDRYEWEKRGEAELDFTFPLETLGSINSGNMFQTLLAVAAVKYNESLIEKPEEE